VLRSEAQADAAGLRATAQRGSRWPTIALRASLSRSMSLSSYDALFELNPQNRAFSFGMNLNFPLFTGFQTSAGIANATLEERNAEAALRVAGLSVERSVRGALIDVRNTYRGLQLAERSAELSLERLRLARERYAIGAIDFASLQLIINGAAGGERQLVNARFQFAQAVVALEEVVGQPVRP
jgi:outer membrane protein